MSTLPISIVIPAKNEIANLPRLIRSLASQTVRPLEIILADAGSTDGTRELAARAGIKVVEGGLPGVGRNRGAAAAKGAIYLFLDADVVLSSENFLARAYSQFEARGLDIASVAIMPLEGRVIDEVFHRIYNRYVRALGRRLPHTAGACLMVRADLFKKVGGFREDLHFCEDMDFGIRASSLGNFGFLRGVAILTGMRRFLHDGYLITAKNYLRAETYIILHRPIRAEEFEYDLEYKSPRRRRVLNLRRVKSSKNRVQ